MDAGLVSQLLLNFFLLTAKLAAPLLVTALAMGLLIGLVQAVTQVNDATLGFLPKMVVVAIALLLCWPWIQQEMVEYTYQIFHLIERTGR